MGIFILWMMTDLNTGLISNGKSHEAFHIQTDEGDDRFFEYRTLNGQYRKERRLSNGTVLGMFGWVDSDGLLRLTDYISDTSGYRILNSKTQYVGVRSEDHVNEVQQYTSPPPPTIPAAVMERRRRFGRREYVINPPLTTSSPPLDGESLDSTLPPIKEGRKIRKIIKKIRRPKDFKPSHRWRNGVVIRRRHIPYPKGRL